MPSIAVLLRGMGALLVLHSAYSCLHYRSILQNLDLLDVVGTNSSSSVSVPPLDVYLEVALALVVLLAGELMGMGPLQSVELMASSGADNTTTKRKSLAAPAYRTRDFDIYSNRSKMLLHRAAKTR